MHLQAENHDGEREFTRGQKWVAAHEKEVIRQGAQVPGVPRPAGFNSEDTQGRAAGESQWRGWLNLGTQQDSPGHGFSS